MNKYLEKIAAEAKKEEHVPSNTAIGIGTAMQASLPAVLGYNVAKEALGSGQVTGVQTLYHGTTPERASKIRAEGLRPGASVGIGAALDKDNGTNTLGSSSHVFATRDKIHASGYVDSSTRIQNAEDPVSEGRRLANLNATNPGKRAKDLYLQHAKSFTQGYGEGSPYLKLKVPLQGGPERVVNPELEVMKHSLDFMFAPKSHQEALIKHLGERTATFKGEVPTKYIVGSNDFRPTTLSDVVHHIKNNPKMAAGGIGKLTGGVGLMAASVAGGKTLYEHRVEEADKKRHEKSADDHSDSKMNPATAAAAAGLGMGSGVLMGYHSDPRRAAAIRDMQDAQDTLNKTKTIQVPRNPSWSTAEYNERMARANKNTDMTRLGAKVTISANAEKLKELRSRAGKLAAGGALIGAGLGYGIARAQGSAPKIAIDEGEEYETAGSALPKVMSGALGGAATAYLVPAIMRGEHTSPALVSSTQKSLAKVLIPMGALSGYLKHKAKVQDDE